MLPVLQRIWFFLGRVWLFFFCLSFLSFSLSWLDLKAQATCMLRRLDDAPPTPSPMFPPTWVCLGKFLGLKTLALWLLHWLFLFFRLLLLLCLVFFSSSLVKVGLRDTAQGNRFTHTHCTHIGAPFLSCYGDSSYRPFCCFFSFSLFQSPLSAAVSVLSQRF